MVESLLYIFGGMIVYFLMQYRMAPDSLSTWGAWFKYNKLNIITYVVLAVAMVTVLSLKLTRVEAFAIGVAPNYLLDWLQTFKKKA